MVQSERKKDGQNPVFLILFPREPRRFPFNRFSQNIVRTIHIVSMGMILGGVARGGDHDSLWTWIVMTVVSGLCLFGIDLYKTGRFMIEGSGVAVWIKLGLIGLGNLFPGARLELYIAATAVASIGSHMGPAWRHFSFWEWRVTRYKNNK